ncbi:hypothetical protein [Methanobacterium sp. MBAC-LM]|jgi:hypothetical protein|uniref:hypothetical protein n=1 Tax=Methanobacterium sp. MBAC-LM TaxID=3412034 RepID=UPI003C716F23
MREEGSERKSMSEKERKEMEEQEKTAEVWIEESKERSSSDITKQEEKGKTPRVDSDLPTFEGKTIVNPPEGGGKILKGSRGETAAGAKCGYPSKPCDR